MPILRSNPEQHVVARVAEQHSVLQKSFENFPARSLDAQASILQREKANVDSIRKITTKVKSLDALKRSAKAIYSTNYQTFAEREMHSLQGTVRLADATFDDQAVAVLQSHATHLRSLAIDDGTKFDNVTSFEKTVQDIANRKKELLAFEAAYDGAVRKANTNVGQRTIPALTQLLMVAEPKTQSEKAMRGLMLARLTVTRDHLQTMREAEIAVGAFETAVAGERGRADSAEARRLVGRLSEAEDRLPADLKETRLSTALRQRLDTAYAAMAARRAAADAAEQFWRNQGVASEPRGASIRRNSFAAKFGPGVSGRRSAAGPSSQGEPPTFTGDRKSTPYGGAAPTRNGTPDSEPPTFTGDRKSTPYGGAAPTRDNTSTRYGSARNARQANQNESAGASSSARSEQGNNLHHADYPSDINPTESPLSRIHAGTNPTEASPGSARSGEILYETRLFSMTPGQLEKHPGTYFKDIAFHSRLGDPVIVFSSNPNGMGKAVERRNKRTFVPMSADDRRQLLERFDAMAQQGELGHISSSYMNLMDVFMSKIRQA